ncbi:MAG: hypothetical protein K2I42_05090, partial [Anaeroplasmataceae bacterium]|nr:hypothetical protein [Anaeroplasmataceae bacterium]
LNIYQQAHYQFRFYLKHFLLNLLFYDLFPVAVLLIGVYHQDIFVIQMITSIYLVLYSIFYLFARVRLKFTKRSIRLGILGLLYLGIGFIPYVGIYLLLCIEFSIIPLLCLERCLSFLINHPYLSLAKRKMKDYSNLSIGITGSFGKTSTKVLLNQALNLYEPTAATPKSYNTELGISKFINSISDLNIFDNLIFEFGASHRNDILKLKKIVYPKHVFVTGIGYMHVESFGSLDCIIKEKMRITDGCEVAVLNFDSPYIRAYPLPREIKKITYGIYYGDYRAKNIKGGSFDVYNNETLILHVNSFLVGNHQILNLTGIIAYLYEMGYDMNRLEKGILSFKTEKNRLEVKKMPTYTLLDDSFNSNYKGFVEALNILRIHEGKRFLLTPGMVELGKYKKELFENLVSYIAASTDIVILIGYYQTKYLYFRLKKYNKEIYLVRNFMEGYRLFLMLVKNYEGAMLLIENDLPDLYRVGLL